jgi:enamine deaminase RidA (YjgF/YER057c/UK114 family)
MPATRGYTHVVETRGPSRTIYLAGQLGMTPDGKFAGNPGDFRAQAARAFENLKLALAAAGASFEHVVKVTPISPTWRICRSISKCATAM